MESAKRILKKKLLSSDDTRDFESED